MYPYEEKKVKTVPFGQLAREIFGKRTFGKGMRT